MLHRQIESMRTMVVITNTKFKNETSIIKSLSITQEYDYASSMSCNKLTI